MLLKMKQDIIEKIEIPEKVEIIINELVTVKGPKGEVKKKLFHPLIVNNNSISEATLPASSLSQLSTTTSLSLTETLAPCLI
ncbi:50S ribosomal protein L6, partial [Candidatus Woesearchaeota archaeon]|nr:50S ribosomal protein L6 [Candidatus Woesearchaeota archaeon]